MVIRKSQMDAETGTALEAKMGKSGHRKGQVLQKCWETEQMKRYHGFMEEPHK